jgi:hypothetical protein
LHSKYETEINEMKCELNLISNHWTWLMHYMIKDSSKTDDL